MKIKEILKSKSERFEFSDQANKFYFVIIALLIFFAYLPTFQYDYANNDQWRAFKYSIFDEPPLVKAYQSYHSRIDHDLRTGRPFFSIGEYIEHSFVSRIGDFKKARPLEFLLVLFTAFCVGVALSPSVGGVVNGTAIGALFVFSPGYSFMYNLGFSTVMVLISLILATLSYILIRQVMNDESDKNKLILSSVLFLVACMIYPPWAFAVFIFSLIDFLFCANIQRNIRLKNLFMKVFFFAVISSVYYLIIKIIIILLPADNHIYYLPGYEFSANFNTIYLIKRFFLAVLFYVGAPPLNTLYSSLNILNVIFPILVIVIGTILFFKNNNGNLVNAVFSFLITVLLCAFLLFFSIIPWLVSTMSAPGIRIFITFPLLMCALLGWLFYQFSIRFFSTKKYLSTILIIFIMLFPLSAIQNKRSAIEVGISGTEIEAMRLIVHKWIDAYSFTKQRYIVVVRPQRPRPLFYDRVLNNVVHGVGFFKTPDNPLYYFKEVSELTEKRNDHDHIWTRLARCLKYTGYAETLQFSANPVYYQTMFAALIREKCDRQHPFGLMKIYIADHATNEDVDKILDYSPYNIVFTVVNQGETIKTKHDILEINFSLITSLPEPLTVDRK